ncbi:hypothetical protein TWF191_004555 [Orbilia oligospora]|uniref:Uncharacterized protein n=1 Tax=Orbilia oligospora TaxID=2813651 RepID=A0A7C8UT96_ORBOL|nr:hypothetical protein TWF191_004555 [Orbilia oligospora]
MKSELISPIETMKLEMKEPEVIYTIRHLEAAGREFFKFSNEKATIEFIHKSVLDWVIKESEAAEKFYSGQMPITKIFKFEENGEMQITVPRNFLEGYSGNFQGTKEAYLDILIYTLEVLANTRFQERYIPTYYSLKDPVSPTDPYLPCPSTPPDDAMRERARAMTEDSNHHRGELTHLDFYMFEVSQSWAIGERKGTKWAKLHGLLHKLSDPKVFARLSTQFLLLNNVKLDDILKPSEVITPAILAAEFQWGLYLDFLVTNATVEPASYPEALNEGPPKWKWYNILSDLQRSSIFGYSILHTKVDTMKVMLKYDLEPNLCFNGVLTPEGPTLFSVLLMYHKRQKDGSGTRELWLPRYLASRFLWSPEGVLEYMEKSDFTKSAYEALITTQPYAKWLLHTLVSYDQGDLISKIMVAGADLYDRDEEGWDTFDWAYAHGLEVGEQEGYTDVDYEARRLDWDRSGNKVEKWETKHRALRAAEDGLRIRGLEEHELEGR